MDQIHKSARKQRGTSLIEMMIAMLVLTVGLLGSAAVTAVAINSDSRSKNDSMSTAVAQMVIDEISSVPMGGPVTTVTVTDCAGTVSTINTSGLAAGAGATLTASGTVSYAQTFNTVTAGYAIKYTACNLVNGTRVVYDIRWNITTAPSGKEEFVVAAAQSLNSTTKAASLNAPAVNLRTVVGNQGN